MDETKESKETKGGKEPVMDLAKQQKGRKGHLASLLFNEVRARNITERHRGDWILKMIVLLSLLGVGEVNWQELMEEKQGCCNKGVLLKMLSSHACN